MRDGQLSTEDDPREGARADDLEVKARALTAMGRQFLAEYRAEHVRDFIDQTADAAAGYADRVADELAAAPRSVADEWADERPDDPGTIR